MRYAVESLVILKAQSAKSDNEVYVSFSLNIVTIFWISLSIQILPFGVNIIYNLAI